ncbi:MAG: MBL fold metallo-hydrolase [Bacillota bacterium]|nr:MBL fold metallo-hydrolase [Bacillota bacterium]
MEIELAVRKLQESDPQLRVLSRRYEGPQGPYWLLGVLDLNPARNLGGYQNQTYFLLTPDRSQAVVIDPGLREGERVREALGIRKCSAIITHYHIDHWIGSDAYADATFYMSEACAFVLTNRLGVGRGGQSIFTDGRLTDYHRTPTPPNVLKEWDRILPFHYRLVRLRPDETWRHPHFPLEFFELPYGQTEGTLYGLLEPPGQKILFGSDLFIKLNGMLCIEPHYSMGDQREVIDRVLVALEALLGQPAQPLPGPANGPGGDTYSQLWAQRLRRLAHPTTLALGHGLWDLAECQAQIEHLVAELKEYRRIEREHII